MLTDRQKRVISALQGDIPITERPYRQLAEGLGMSESDLLETLSELRDRKVLRRFGATLKHQKSGYAANAMVAWQVAEDRIDAVGRIMAASRNISPCYRRDPTDDWPYNLYTMLHAKSEDSCHKIAGRLAEKAGVDVYTLLFSRKELKKTSMQYF
jgi:DNA-binding Lrp family transcriptional regulator